VKIEFEPLTVGLSMESTNQREVNAIASGLLKEALKLLDRTWMLEFTVTGEAPLGEGDLILGLSVTYSVLELILSVATIFSAMLQELK